MILAAAVLAQEYTYKPQHEAIVADLNRYTAKTLHLIIILMDDAIMYTCTWSFACHKNYKPLQFIDISLAISHLFNHQSKRKR